MLGSLIRGLIRDQIKLATARWNFRRIFPWRRPPRVAFVAATRLTQDDFWTDSALGASLQRIKGDARVDIHLSFENASGLPEIYNRALKSCVNADIVVFLHDDVWLADERLFEKLEAALARFDVVGVAGNVRRVAAQPAWAFSCISNSEFVWDHDYLSGAIHHGNPGGHELSSFGPAPARCELLDGVFLACRRSELVRREVGFDERFAFHFYDLDFCRSARQAGLKLGTWPIDLIHQSQGAFGSPGWIQAYEVYLGKWKQ